MAETFKGNCHCGAVQIAFETALAPEKLGYRLCECSYCRKLAPVYFADPHGIAHLSGMGRLGIYRFGHKTADFVHCRTCFVYVGAICEIDGRAYAVLNARLFDDLPVSDSASAAFDYDAESMDDRIERRAQRWTPVTLV